MAAAQLEGNRRRRMRTVDDELFELLIRLMAVAEFGVNSATFVLPAPVVVRGWTADVAPFWQSWSKCILPSWMYRITGLPIRFSVCWTRWASHNRHQARTAAFIMWRTGLRVSEVLELEWRDLDYSGEPATLLVRKSKTHKARTVRLHQDLVQLFTNWPANRSPRDKVVALAMRTALRHIGDGIEWASLDEESPGTGKRRGRNS